MQTAGQLIVLNGSHGEGGGSIVRTALALSAHTQQPVRIHNVRGGTRTPGVNAEDLACIGILAESTAAEVMGDELGSPEIVFAPGRAPRSVDTEVDIHGFQAGRVDGSAVIVAHAVMPVLARTGAFSFLRIHGETHVNGALSYDAFTTATTWVHNCQGLYTLPTLTKAGIGPATRGRIDVAIEPSAIQGIQWGARSADPQVQATITSVDAERVSQQCAETVLAQFEREGGSVDLQTLEVDGPEPGLCLTLTEKTATSCFSTHRVALRGSSAASLVGSVATVWSEWSKSSATVDQFLADQALLPASLAEGKSVFHTPRVTRRLITVAWVIRQFLPIHVTIKGREGSPGKVTVER